jgi:cell division protein FtsW (lipid II flippase)
MVFLAFKTAWLIAQKSDLGTAVFLGLIVAIIGGMAQPWEQHKLVYFLFGSVLALQLHYSGRSAPSADEHERHT